MKEEGEEEKEKGKRKEEEEKRCIRPVRLRVCANIKLARRRRCPPQASLFLRGTSLFTK
jgi:hypothetical protein